MGRPGPVADTERQTVSESVYRALKRDILTLRHPPGTALREQELADRYGASRVPVREAFRRLQQDRLLESVPYKGYYVRPVSVGEIADAYDLRLVLETHAVRRAVARATPEQIARLQDLSRLEYTYHDWDSYAVFLEKNLEFHIALAELCGNGLLVGVLRDLLEGMQRYFFLGLHLGSFGAEMREEHEALIRAIREGSEERAVECTARQIERSRERIVRALMGTER